jgi:hypothetical protein
LDESVGQLNNHRHRSVKWDESVGQPNNHRHRTVKWDESVGQPNNHRHRTVKWDESVGQLNNHQHQLSYTYITTVQYVSFVRSYPYKSKQYSYIKHGL